jgi:hypothetical protein
MHDTLTRLRLQRGAQHLHSLGPSAVAGFIEDLSARIGGLPAAVGLLAEYETKPAPASTRAAQRDRASPCRAAEVAR